MTFENRLEALEKELKRAKRQNLFLLGAVMLAAVIGLAGAAHSSSGKEVRANKFVLEDGNGKMRAVLMVTKTGPTLLMNNENDEPAVLLYASKEMWGLDLSDGNGKIRISLTANDKMPGLTLTDKNGAVCGGFSSTKDGPEISLFNAKGKTLWSAP